MTETPLPTTQVGTGGPPDGLPTYRLLTGPDDASFCRRVSDALALGYRLYGSPAHSPSTGCGPSANER